VIARVGVGGGGLGWGWNFEVLMGNPE
jgi:hypothetical protein